MPFTRATDWIVNLEIRQTARLAAEAGEPGKELFVLRRLIHGRVFAFNVQDDDRPTLLGSFLDQDLRRIRFAGANRAEDADIARNHFLVFTLEADRQVCAAGHVAQEHVPGETHEARDFLHAERPHCGPRRGPIVGVEGAAINEFALYFDLRGDCPFPAMAMLGTWPAAIREERPLDNAAQKLGTRRLGIDDAHELIAEDPRPVVTRRFEHDTFVRRARLVVIDLSEQIGRFWRQGSFAGHA